MHTTHTHRIREKTPLVYTHTYKDENSISGWRTTGSPSQQTQPRPLTGLHCSRTHLSPLIHMHIYREKEWNQSKEQLMLFTGEVQKSSIY